MSGSTDDYIPTMKPHNKSYTARDLKPHKVVVVHEKAGMGKPAGQSAEFSVELPEIRLLAELYVPPKLLIRNNKVPKAVLLRHLPELVPGFPELNFELHVLLAGIVANFVCSWYARLNSDSSLFVASVYDGLCLVVGDLATRGGNLVTSDHVLLLLDRCADILADHVTIATSEGSQPAISAKLAAQAAATNTVHPKTLQSFLQSQHVIFENSEAKLDYFRVLAKNVLQLSAPKSTDSPIVTSLLTLTVADLVLDGTFTKLTKLDFWLNAAPLLAPRTAHKQSKKPLIPRVYTILRSAWSLAVAVKRSILATTSQSRWSVFSSPVWKLVDALLGVSARFSGIYHLLCILGTAFSPPAAVVLKIDGFCRDRVLSWLWGSAYVQDHQLASVVAELRQKIFSAGPSTPPASSEETARLLFSRWNELLGGHVMWCAYKDESEEAIIAKIHRVLQGFEYCEDGRFVLNELLAVQFLDCIVLALWPELGDTVYAG